MQKLNLDPKPPRANGIMWVERIAGGERQQFTVYSPAILGIWTHYSRSGTRPCYAEQEHCEGGHCEETLRWKGYIHCWSFRMNRAVVLQLTAAASNIWLEQVAGNANLRGQRIEVWRTKGENGRVRVSVNEYLATGTDHLPPPQDILPSLYSLWKMKPTLFLPDAKNISRPQELPGEMAG